MRLLSVKSSVRIGPPRILTIKILPCYAFDMESNQLIGKRLRHARLAAGLDGLAASRVSGIKLGRLADLERGFPANTDEIKKICMAYHLLPSWELTPPD